MLRDTPRVWTAYATDAQPTMAQARSSAAVLLLPSPLRWPLRAGWAYAPAPISYSPLDLLHLGGRDVSKHGIRDWHEQQTYYAAATTSYTTGGLAVAGDRVLSTVMINDLLLIDNGEFIRWTFDVPACKERLQACDTP